MKSRPPERNHLYFDLLQQYEFDDIFYAAKHLLKRDEISNTIILITILPDTQSDNYSLTDTQYQIICL